MEIEADHTATAGVDFSEKLRKRGVELAPSGIAHFMTGLYGVDYVLFGRKQ